MRYTLQNSLPVRVTSLVNGSVTIINPTDAIVDELEAGYPLEEVAAPSYNAETQHAPTFVWDVVEGVIKKVWTVTNKTEEELKQEQIAGIDTQIAALNSSFEAWKSLPLTWSVTSKGYLPRWVTEFYTPLIVLGSGAFPQSVTAYDGTADVLSYEQFATLYAFLIQQSATETIRVNTLLAGLYTQKAALEAEAA